MSMYMPVGSLASASLGFCPIRGLLEISLASCIAKPPVVQEGSMFVPISVNPVGLHHHDHDGDEDRDDADADSC